MFCGFEGVHSGSGALQGVQRNQVFKCLGLTVSVIRVFRGLGV